MISYSDLFRRLEERKSGKKPAAPKEPSTSEAIFSNAQDDMNSVFSESAPVIEKTIENPAPKSGEASQEIAKAPNEDTSSGAVSTSEQEPTPATDKEIDLIFSSSAKTQVMETVQEVPETVENMAATDREIDDIFAEDLAPSTTVEIEAAKTTTVNAVAQTAATEEFGHAATEAEIDDIFSESPAVSETSVVEEDRAATEAEIDDIFAAEPADDPQKTIAEDRPATEAEIDDIFSEEPNSEEKDEIDSIFEKDDNPSPDLSNTQVVEAADIDGIFSDFEDSQPLNKKNLGKVATSDTNNVNLSDPLEKSGGAEKVVDPSSSAAASEEEIDALFGEKAGEIAEEDVPLSRPDDGLGDGKKKT